MFRPVLAFNRDRRNADFRRIRNNNFIGRRGDGEGKGNFELWFIKARESFARTKGFELRNDIGIFAAPHLIGRIEILIIGRCIFNRDNALASRQILTRTEISNTGGRVL